MKTICTSLRLTSYLSSVSKRFLRYIEGLGVYDYRQKISMRAALNYSVISTWYAVSLLYWKIIYFKALKGLQKVLFVGKLIYNFFYMYKEKRDVKNDLIMIFVQPMEIRWTPKGELRVGNAIEDNW